MLHAEKWEGSQCNIAELGMGLGTRRHWDLLNWRSWEVVAYHCWRLKGEHVGLFFHKLSSSLGNQLDAGTVKNIRLLLSVVCVCVCVCVYVCVCE